MGANDTTIFIAGLIAFLVVMWRLHRLGAQLEAVCHVVQIEVASPERQRELVQEWKSARDDIARERRRFWWFWGIVGLAVLFWIASKVH